MSDHVELIAYPDRLAPGISGLVDLVDGPFSGLFGGVHLLPFFLPIDGSDAGFDPNDHRRVDPRIGTWADVDGLADRGHVTADLIVNHVSANSAPFRDFLEHGSRSAFADMFLTFGKVFPDGATESDLLTIYRPRPELPFTVRTFADGRRRIMWTTFTADQIDLDVESESAVAYLHEVLDRLAKHGVSTVRLDAAGYAIKRAGTSCFMIPETFDFIERLARRARSHGQTVLVEVHTHHRAVAEIAAHVDLVYDFALPPLLLHALFAGDLRPLAEWMEIRPLNCVTVLDTHDGIGVVDVAPTGPPEQARGLLDTGQIDALVEGIHERSGGSSRLATGAAASNVDLYQVNCTFYDALGRDDTSYILARLVQLLMPGRPQIYYVGLLAGENDMDLLAATGVGRDINRHRYTVEEIGDAVRKPVVRALFAAIRLRGSHPAFAGDFSCWTPRSSTLELRWRNGDAAVHLRADFEITRFELRVEGEDGSSVYTAVDELAATEP